jgi:WD40 repeat protein
MPKTSRFDPKNFTSLAFTPDGRTMVMGNDSLMPEFMLWSASNAGATAYELKRAMPATDKKLNYGDIAHKPEHVRPVVAVSPDGKLLATGYGADLKNSGGVKLWDIEKLLDNPGEKPEELFTLSQNTLNPTSLAFSSDSRTLAVVGSDGVQLWDVSTKRPFEQATQDNHSVPAKLKRGRADDVVACVANSDLVGGVEAVSPDGKIRAFALGVMDVVLWNAAEPSPPSSLKRMLNKSGSVVRTMVFSPDSELLAVGGGGSGQPGDFNGPVTLWNAQEHKYREEIKGHEGVKVAVTSIAFSLDSKILATGATDKTIELWDISESPAKLLVTLEGHKYPITSVAFSDDYKTIASGDAGGTVNLWNVSSHQLLITLKAASVSITAVAFSEGDDIVFTKDKDGEIRLWPAAPREQAERLLEPTSSIPTRFGFDNRRPAGSPEAQPASLLLNSAKGQYQQLDYDWKWRALDLSFLRPQNFGDGRQR